MSILRHPCLVIGAGALLAGGALAGCSGDPEVPTRSLGTVMPALGEPEGDPLDVRVPTGRMIVTIGQPQATVPTSEGRVGVDGEGAWVGISWQTDTSALPQTMRTGDGDFPLAHLTLVVGEERYSLDDVALRDGSGEPLDSVPGDAVGPLGADGGAWIAVDGAREGAVVAEASLEVEFDGLVQRFDPTVREAIPARGTAAQALYGTPDELARAPRSCATAEVPGAAGRGVRLGRDDATCDLRVARVPWLAQRGWVSGPDQRWLVVDAVVFPAPVVRIGGRTCGVYALSAVRGAVDGRPLLPASETGDGSVRFVVEVEDDAERAVALTAQQEPSASGVAGANCPSVLPLRWRATV